MTDIPILQRMIAIVRANAVNIAMSPDDIIANILNQPYGDSILFMGIEEELANYRRLKGIHEDSSEEHSHEDEGDPDKDGQGGSKGQPGEENPKEPEGGLGTKPSKEPEEQEPDGKPKGKKGEPGDKSNGPRPMTRKHVADEGLKIVKKGTKAGKDTQFQVRNKDSDSSEGNRLSPSSQGSEQSYASALKKPKADEKRPVQSPLPKAHSGNGKPKKGQQPSDKSKTVQERFMDKLRRNQSPYKGSKPGPGWVENKKKNKKKGFQGQGTVHGGLSQPKG